MKKSHLSLRMAGFAAAITFGLTACGDEVTKYYDSDGHEISEIDTLLVTEVVKEQDTIKFPKSSRSQTPSRLPKW